MTVTFGSVCSGIEAATAAWGPLGWQCAFMSEIEPFPRAVLQHHYPEVPLHGDFTTIRAGEYRPIDLLVGGTPCQSFSVAGLRGGLEDDRGNLALEYLRLADRLRPRWLVWENVPGVLSSSGGRDFGAILGGMVELGYGFAYRVLDAQFFGVAQRRRRVFVVGYLGDWRRAAAVLFERHSLQGHPAPRREAGTRSAAPIAAGSRDGSGYRLDADTAENLVLFGLDDGGEVARSLTASHTATGRLDPNEQTFVATVAGTLGHNRKAAGSATNQDAQSGLLVAFSSKDHGADAEHDLSPTLRAGGHSASHAKAGVPPAIAFALRGREGGAMLELGGDQIGALCAASGGSSRDYVAFAQNTRDEVREMPYVGALAADPGMKQTSYIRGGSAVRRLTPVECERLQGFPDDFTLIPWRKGMAPDGPRYKALGNSMAVPVMSWIGRRIEAVEALSQQVEAA